ncbi:related to hydrolases of the alpha/beta superfamily [Phialocephala subalpina]|uniref:Related to hydrolases of the alpha/beta superfamily n=1 Tax=Phialocephala subalpina TaxID=576137 RepID=A0A1L7WTP2_9HELO|nr:related to hydrolases of the alpha/beta superfamily [Phialocephala subalpina]
MPREDIAFQTSDNVTLRGWFYTPEASSTTPLPCLVITHGFSAVKEMNLDVLAARFTCSLPISCLVYDHRGFGASDNQPSAPRQEIIPSLQCSDISDAITYAQGREDVNKEKIGIWGTALSGGHALYVGAVDRRVKAVLSQVPVVSGWENAQRLARPGNVAELNHLFQEDRLARAAGKPAGTIPAVDLNPLAISALSLPEAYEWLAGYSLYKNEVTVKTIEEFRAYNPSANIHHISPTPLLMTVVENDDLMPTDLALAAYARALEPKELQLLPGSHFSVFGPNFEKTVERQVDFLKRTLLA